LIAGLVAKIPDLFHLRPDYFFQKNIGFVVFPFLTSFYLWKNKESVMKMIVIFLTYSGLIAYINLLPGGDSSDTLILACMHLVFILWVMLGYAFTGKAYGSHEKRILYLRYNGDLIVMSAIILLTGGIFSGITIGLFSVIGIDTIHFFQNYIILWGLPATPIIATYLLHVNPKIVNKVSPVIAKAFTPLVFIMLSIYLTAFVTSSKNLFQNREFLMIFNLLLIGVLALIFFSISEHAKNVVRKRALIILLLLTLITIVINGITLSAIFYRLTIWGITPNRIAVMGGNILIFLNLLLIGYDLFRTVLKNESLDFVEKRITGYIPLYAIWAGIVTFVLPLIFKFT
jgi:hypothetical protein